MHGGAYARRLPALNGMHRFIPALISAMGGTYAQIPVRHSPRIAGKSKFNLSNRFWGPIRDAFHYRWYLRRYVDSTVSQSDLD